MNRAQISQAVGQIDLKFVQEAMEPGQNPARGETAVWKSPAAARRKRICRMAAGLGMALLAVSLATVTAFAASGTFRRTVISFLYPLYSTGEIKALDQGHSTGSFGEQDTLLSFLDRFNAEKLEFGVRAEKDGGYTYSMASGSPDVILAVVDCNISGYKLLVTMNRLAYEDTAGIWQVVSYQMVTEQAAGEILEKTPEYTPRVDVLPGTEASDAGAGPSDSVIQTEGANAVIYSAADKDHIVTLTEEESAQAAELFGKYPVTDAVTAEGLQDRVVRYEDILYAFSEDGAVIVMDGKQAGPPLGQFGLSAEDLKILMELFESHGL